MCAPFSVHDDELLDPEATKALNAIIEAERRRLTLALLVASGATRRHFPRHDADSAIAATVGDVTARRYEMDRLIASRAMGERAVISPTPSAQVVELQQRVQKNEAATKADILVFAAHARGAALAAALPPMSPDYQAGFINCAGA